MLLYLLEIDEQGLVKQLAITEGEIKDFENSPMFKAFTNQAEAEACMGKRWNGETWEAVTPTETAPTVPEEKAGVTNEMLEKEMKEIKAMVMEIGMASVKPPSELPELPPELPKLNSLPPLPEGMTIDTDLLKSMMGGS